MVNKAMELSVVIPCLNEEETIAYVVENALQGIKKAKVHGEVVVVDNGSIDKSRKIATKKGARVIFSKKRGYGNALQYGFNHANGRYIIMADADGSYDFRFIPHFVKKFRKEYEFVVGSRFKGKIHKGAMPFLHQYLGTPVLTFILNRFFRSHFSDCNSGMRGFSKSAINKLHLESHGMEFASEMLVKTALLQLKSVEVPIDYFPDKRKKRRPHLHTWQDGWRHLKFLLLYAPHYLFEYPGIILFVVGTILIITQASRRINLKFIHLDLHFMILGLFFGLLGFTLIQLGIGLEIISSKKGFTVGIFWKLVQKIFKLENMVLLGLIIFLIGFSIDFFILIQWIHLGFDKIVYWREALISTYTMSLGLQLILFSFFFDILRNLQIQ